MTALRARDNLVRHWLKVLLVAGLIGYPLLGTLIVLTPLPSLVASIPMRLLVALAAMVILLNTRARRMAPPAVALWVFWSLYTLRLAWDATVAGVPGADEAMLFFATTCLLPAAAIMRVPVAAFDEGDLAQPLLWCGVATCVLAIAITVSGIASGRSLLPETGRLAFDTVNPITYGHVAASTLIAAIALWRRRGRQVGASLLVVTALAAASTLQLSGSRGPALALAICLLAVGVYQARLRWLAFAVTGLIVAIVLAGGTALEERISNVEDDPSTLERIVVQTNAIEQFLQSPWTGSAYIETELMIYPHNPFIEAAMATGVVGLILFTYVFAAVLVRILRLLRQGRILLPLLALQYTVGAALSGALYLSTAMWALFALVLAVTQARTAPRQKRPPALALSLPR